MKLRALIAMVALLAVPFAWAVKPGEVEPIEIPMDELLMPVKPLPANQQVLGMFRIEGLPDGTTTVTQVKAPDMYFPEGTLGAAAKVVVDQYVRLDGLSYTECYQDALYTQRCDQTPGLTGIRFIRMQNMFYDHPENCDYIWANPVAQLTFASNCTLQGSGVTAGGPFDICGNTVHDPDDPEPGRDGRFDVVVTVNVLNPARFVIYVNLIGQILSDPTCVSCVPE